MGNVAEEHKAPLEARIQEQLNAVLDYWAIKAQYQTYASKTDHDFSPVFSQFLLT